MIFETDKDRHNQNRLQAFLESKGYQVTQTGTTAHYDMMVHIKGRLHALIEFKQRDKLWNPLKIDHSKVSELVSAARSKAVKGLVVIGVDNDFFFAEAHTCWPEGSLLRKRGGQRRGETTDKVFEIPSRDFTRMT